MSAKTYSKPKVTSKPASRRQIDGETSAPDILPEPEMIPEVDSEQESDPTIVDSTIADIVAQSGGEFDDNMQDFDVLQRAITDAELGSVLNGSEADLTVFAPTDAAFVQLANDLGFEVDDEAAAYDAIVGSLTELGDGDPQLALQSLLEYHVSPGEKTSKEIKAANAIETLLAGETLATKGNKIVDGNLDIADPKFAKSLKDVKASNGIVQGIDRVLLPADFLDSEGDPTDDLEPEESPNGEGEPIDPMEPIDPIEPEGEGDPIDPMEPVDPVTPESEGDPLNPEGQPDLTDVLNGTADDDVLVAKSGSNFIVGFAGNDVAIGGTGDDYIIGGAGQDFVLGNGGKDVIFGGSDKDLIVTTGMSFVSGGMGDDLLFGESESGRMYGDDGNDVIVVSEDSTAAIYGGLGDDLISLQGAAAKVVLEADKGTDTVEGFEVGQTTLGLSEGLTFSDLTFVDNEGSTSILSGQKAIATVLDTSVEALSSESNFV